jgi:hypothetical protein
MAASGKTVAVLQSNYIPWKGYFDIIHDVDEFIFYDDVQYTKGDWRNRNLIKTPKGTEWLTVPVGTNLDRLICEVAIEVPSWQARHWGIVQQHYSRAPHFSRYRSFFQEVYAASKWANLSVMNQHLITRISRELLGVRTEFRDSREYQPTGQKLERLFDLLQKAQATTYVSGPSAKDYIDPLRFEEAGIGLVWKDYSGYPEYPQFFGPFTHQVSILDLLFQVGPVAPEYIWGWREKRA